MITKEVILKFHEHVPFPWSPRKIKKAGLDPTRFLIDFGIELEKCHDKDTPLAKGILEMLQELKLFDAGGGG